MTSSSGSQQPVQASVNHEAVKALVSSTSKVPNRLVNVSIGHLPLFSSRQPDHRTDDRWLQHFNILGSGLTMRLVVIALCIASCAFCGDWSSLYDAQRLESQRERLTEDVNLVIAQEIQPFLTSAQARAFSDIQIDLPLSAEPAANPFDFYSARAGNITLPLLTVAFVEDMSEAYSWLWANRYSSQTVDEYVGMLRSRASGDFPGNHYPTPIEALHVPANALENPAVAQMTDRVRATTLSFMLLHQFGHLSHRTASEEATLKHDRVNGEEEWADNFALEVMKKNSEPPAGLLMLIHGMLYLPTVPPKQHPVSRRRLNTMADYLDARVREFAEGRPNPRLTIVAIRSLADHIRSAALFLSDTTGQKLWAEQSNQTTISSLMPRRVGQ